MRNGVYWETDMDPIQANDIIKIEHILNITFPDDYKQCIYNNHGGYPNPCVYDLENDKEKVFGFLLCYDTEDELNILDNYKAIKDRLPQGIIPFADDPFGNNICFDYREGKDNPPKIVFWDHEMASIDPEKAITYICDSFTELLEKLYDPEEE